MKKFLIVSVLAVGLGFPLTSQAEVTVLGVQQEVERTEVPDKLRDSYVAQDLGDTFKVQKLNNNELREVEISSEKDNVYSVFGVNISGDQVI
jgi:hypothetical protein